MPLRAPIIYLNGPSSAGKSTLAKALVAAMEDPWCLVSMDTFEGMASRRFPLPGAQAFYDQCIVPLIHHAAGSFANQQLGVVVDAVLGSPQWLHDATQRLAAHRVFLVAVRCDLAELQRRERERGNRNVGVAERQFAYVHKVVDDRCGYDFEVDTTHASANECASSIKSHLATNPEPTALSRLRHETMSTAAPYAERVPVPELRTPRLTLRPLRESDAQDRQQCGYDPEFERMLGHDAPRSPEMTPDTAQEWLRARMGMPVCWAIEVGGQCAGTVGFVNLSRRLDWATLSVELFTPALWSRGLGTGAVRLALTHAFHTLGVHRVELQVLSYNHRAIRAYEKCGFVREGVVRECKRVDGEWVDDVTMSILDREFCALSGTA